MSLLRIALGLVIGGGLLYAVHYYVWARLVRDTHLPAPWSSVATVAIAVLGASVLGGILLLRAPRSVNAPVLWVAYVWLGLLFFLLLLLGLGDLSRGAVALARRVLESGPLDPTRRTFFARALATVVGVSATGLGAVATASALAPVEVKKLRVPLAKLPRAASGTRIVQITDLHVGPTIGRAFLEQIVAQVNALDPDVVVITGDLVDGTVRELASIVAPLARLRARQGVFFVTGNHEYYSGVDEWCAHLPSLGVRVLRNERVALEHFDVAGVEDPTGRPDLPRALAGRDASRALVLLAHQPKAILKAAPMGVDLQLSGHTHGGQIFPWRYAVYLQQPYVAGLHRHEGAFVYVSCGTGYWGPPMRLAAPAEITHIELVSGDGDAAA